MFLRSKTTESSSFQDDMPLLRKIGNPVSLILESRGLFVVSPDATFQKHKRRYRSASQKLQLKTAMIKIPGPLFCKTQPDFSILQTKIRCASNNRNVSCLEQND